MYGYEWWFTIYNITEGDEEESVDIEPTPLLEGDEKDVKEEKWLKILTSNKLLTRLTVLLALIKAWNN